LVEKKAKMPWNLGKLKKKEIKASFKIFLFVSLTFD
jgi:hypothetical protein